MARASAQSIPAAKVGEERAENMTAEEADMMAEGMDI